MPDDSSSHFLSSLGVLMMAVGFGMLAYQAFSNICRQAGSDRVVHDVEANDAAKEVVRKKKKKTAASAEDSSDPVKPRKKSSERRRAAAKEAEGDDVDDDSELPKRGMRGSSRGARKRDASSGSLLSGGGARF